MSNPETPFDLTVWEAHQSVIHAQGKQPRLGAVQVLPKEEILNGLVVGVVPPYVLPALQALVDIRAEHHHCLACILRVGEVGEERL